MPNTLQSNYLINKSTIGYSTQIDSSSNNSNNKNKTCQTALKSNTHLLVARNSTGKINPCYNKTDNSQSDTSSNSFNRQSSNDSSNYSAPPSGGEQPSCEEQADQVQHKISLTSHQVRTGSGGSTGAVSAGAATNRLVKTGNTISKPQGPAKSQDAKQELDSCRVIYIHI